MDRKEKPLIVQRDMNLLLEVDNPLFDEARAAISAFSELIKSPEYLHTYRISALSVWNALALGISVEEILKKLNQYTKHDIHSLVINNINEYARRFQKIKLIKDSDNYFLEIEDNFIFQQVVRTGLLSSGAIIISQTRIWIPSHLRGTIKKQLIEFGYPVLDIAGYAEIPYYPVDLKEKLELRDYQQASADIFYQNGKAEGGSGVIVLPCGAGKTIVGMAVMAQIQTETLIITTSITAVRQWIRELTDKTWINPDDIAEYSGESKTIKPITVATYQILTHKTNDEFKHFELFDTRNWGLIIYDEVHLLPAPVFQVSASLQSKRRLGLTATLVREDNCEKDVFALIGPKKYDMNWKVLEKKGWIAEAVCLEIHALMDDDHRFKYACATPRDKFRLACENPKKMDIVEELLYKHHKERVLIIGQYIEQLEKLQERFGFPIITGKTKNVTRDKIFKDFNDGVITALIVSKVANFAIDLPEANVAIEVSGNFGSRQEEAQRVGRILRPKKGVNKALFYIIVSDDTIEVDFAMKRQLFMIEQGYEYLVLKDEAILDYNPLKVEDD